MILRVGHLYPKYLNIYADRGNIAVLERRAAARGHELRIEPISLGTTLEPVPDATSIELDPKVSDSVSFW